MADWQNPLTPFLWLGMGLIIVVFLVFFLLLYMKSYIKRIRKTELEKLNMAIAYQKQLLINSIDIQEKERSRIAADLHDELIGQLHRIKLINENNKLNDLLGESINSARRISHDLTPPLLNQLSLTDLITDYISPFFSSYKVLLKHQSIGEDKIDKTYKLQIFRIFQEIITNINKHARAKTIDVYLKTTERYIALSVIDDGVGFKKDSSNGLGMKNIELRTQMLGGIYRFRSGRKKGTQFILLVNRLRNEQ